MGVRLSIKSRRIGIAFVLALVLIAVSLLVLLKEEPSPLVIGSMDRMGSTIVCLTSNRSTYSLAFGAYGEAKVNGKWERINGRSKVYSIGPGGELGCQMHFPNTGGVWRVAFGLRRTGLTLVERAKLKWRLWFGKLGMPKMAGLVGPLKMSEEVRYSPEYYY